MIPRRSFTAIAIISLCAACGSGSDESLVTVRDSAGIEIVESRGPQWGEGEEWTVSPDPLLEIGVIEGEEPYLLDRVTGVVRLGDGTVVVANQGDNTLRYYDSSGTFLHSAGGRGGGPTEFSQLSGLRRWRDSVLAWQSRRHPSKVFDARGNFGRALHAQTQDAGIVGVFADGAHLFGLFISIPAPRTDLDLDSSMLWLSTPSFDHADTLVRLPARYFVGIDVSRQRIPYFQAFGPVWRLAVGDSMWYYGWPESYEVQVRDREANVRRIVRRAWEPAIVTDADRERYRASMLDFGVLDPPQQLLMQRRAIVDGMVYPDHHPAFERIVPDATGHLWVERPDPANPKQEGRTAVRETPTTWDVFDPTGAWLGGVEFPPRFYVFEIGEDYVTGVWRDELGIERARVYGVRRER